jgi:glycosyltransferase involved in cell wall biosynthesis
MTRAVFVTQLIDERDPTLGFAVGLVNALAARCNRVVVIANEVRSNHALAPNVSVHSLGKEAGGSRLGRTMKFQRVLGSALGAGADGILVHMAPVYLNLAAPLAKLHRVPLLLWFAHPSRTATLRMADRLCDVVLTSLPGAYPLASDKVRVVGQAIDTQSLRLSDPHRDPSDRHGDQSGLRVVALGRTSPAKGFDVVLRAIAEVRDRGVAVSGHLVGPSSTPLERSHRDELLGLGKTLDLHDVVRIEEAVEPSQVPGVISAGDVLANAMVSGSGDKVVFEAAALGRLPVASNTSFGELLGGLPLDLRFSPGSHEQLADRLVSIARADGATCRATAEELRRRVEKEHSLDHWADAVLDAMRPGSSSLGGGR